MAAKPIPDGYHSVTAYLIVGDGKAAIEFYKQAFGARESMRLEGPGGKIMHAEVRIGDSPVMLADEVPDMGINGPATYGGSPVSLVIYDQDVDSAFQRALDAGAEELRPLVDQFYGDRSGMVRDPFGHTWTIATRKEDLSPEEIEKRMQQQM